jgi:hypothetical protein
MPDIYAEFVRSIHGLAHNVICASCGIREHDPALFVSMGYDHKADDSRMGWMCTMYYSLIQQLVRMDSVWYTMTAAARDDKQWILIAYPYITKDTDDEG